MKTSKYRRPDGGIVRLILYVLKTWAYCKRNNELSGTEIFTTITDVIQNNKKRRIN